MKKLLICLLVSALFLGTCAAHAEISTGYPVAFGTVPWLSAPAELEQYLAQSGYRWSSLADSAGGGRILFGIFAVWNGNSLKTYDRRSVQQTGWGDVIWEGQAMPFPEEMPYAGTTITTIYPIYAVKGDNKQLISVTVRLRAEADRYAEVRDSIAGIFGKPQIDKGNLCLWSDPNSETDSTVLLLMVSGSKLYAVFAEAEIKALMDGLI